MGAPAIDLLASDFYGDVARTAHAWMRANSPVHRDDANRIWGVATYDGVVTVGRDPETYSNAGGTRPDTGPVAWMLDMDAPDHRKWRKLVEIASMTEHVLRRLPDLELATDEPLLRFLGAPTAMPVRFTPTGG